MPEETKRVARAIFPEGNLVMRIYDELDMIFHSWAQIATSPTCFPYRDSPLKHRPGLPL